MPYGVHDRILRVDLTSGKIWTESLGEAAWRRYMGGRALVARYLLTLAPKGCDPFAPENPLIFAPGVLTGAYLSGQGRNGVGAISPLTGGFGNAEGGGFFGAALKRAGYDAVVVTGASARPVYLWIHPDGAELRPADHLWGLTVGEAEDRIRQELGEKVRTALIGPAGENRVRFAAVVNDRSHFAGRTGLGAVMGAKKLKGIAVKGRPGGVPLADPAGISALQKWMGRNLELVAGLHDTGTAGGVPYLNRSGGLPTRNFRAGAFEGHEKISGQTMRDTILIKRETCDACAVRCKRVVALKEPFEIDPRYGGPEYETVAALGSDQGIDDLLAVAKGNELCAAYGLDTISTGAVLAFVMEAVAAGLLSTEEIGIDLRWGNGRAMLEGIRAIAFREGFGDRMAEGVARLAAQLGPEAQEFALHVKGQEVPMHEPRIKHALGVGYALSPTGADHMHNMHDPMYAKERAALQQLRLFDPELQPQPPEVLGEAKMRLYFHHTNWRHFLDSVGMCHFLPYSPEQLRDAVRAATGWDVTLEELAAVGRRAATLARLVNLRQGLDAATDTLPERFFRPFLEGPEDKGRPLDREAFEEAKGIYYRMMGWDEAGRPTPETLEALGEGWAVPLLEG